MYTWKKGKDWRCPDGAAFFGERETMKNQAIKWVRTCYDRRCRYHKKDNRCRKNTCTFVMRKSG